jgi:two-component system, cell cycle sensor histidine kinase and response regulator CckA
MNFQQRIKSFIISSSRLRLVILIVLAANVLTEICTTVQSYLWWGILSTDLLLIGALNATVISFVLAPLVIRFVKQISILEEDKKTRERIEQSEHLYRLMAENITDVVWIYNLEAQQLTYISPSIEKLRGFSVSEVLSQPMEAMLIPESYRTIQSLIAELVPIVVSSGEPQIRVIEIGMRHKNGSVVWVEVAATLMKNHETGKLEILGVTRDIGKRKEVEKALKENEYFLTKSQEVGDAGSYYFTVGIGMWICSKKLDEIFGIDESYKKNVEGWMNLIHPDHAQEMLQYLNQYVIAEHHRFDKEYRIVRINDKQERWVHGLGELEFDAHGNTIRMIGTIQDITKRKRIEEEKNKLQDMLLQSQKMEAIGRLAGGVAHDFNNMIGVILGYATLLEKGMNVADPSLKKIKSIIAAAERCANLTKQLLAFARKQIITPVPLSLNEELNSLKQMLGRLIGEDITLLVFPAQDLWTIKIDPMQIAQILTNLCSNARDAIANVGVISLSTANLVLESSIAIRKDEIPPGEYVMLAFSDTGHGMERSILELVFEPFFTTKPKGEGIGLGLSTVFGIVKQNQGFIDIYSESGQGTTVKIYFPRCYGELERKEEKSEDIPLTGSETVLIVEDEVDLLNFACSSLEMLNYHVLKAQTPSEAITHCELHGKKIDLLITDIVMPGMNGKELQERIKALRPDVKTLFMSGYTADIVAHRGILEEGMHFLQKPFTPLGLAKKVREVLNT